jgi:hypothetical protein
MRLACMVNTSEDPDVNEKQKQRAQRIGRTRTGTRDKRKLLGQSREGVSLRENYQPSACPLPSSRIPAPPADPHRPILLYKPPLGPLHSLRSDQIKSNPRDENSLVPTHHDSTPFQIHPSERAYQKRTGLFACGARPTDPPIRFASGTRDDTRRSRKREMDAFYWTSSSSSGPYGEAAYGGAGWGYDSLKNFRQITPAVQTHLKLVRPASSSSSPPPCVLGSSSSCRACVSRSSPVFLCVAGLASCWGIEGRMWQRPS